MLTGTSPNRTIQRFWLIIPNPDRSARPILGFGIVILP
jgi:hypothetical protein